MEKNFISELLFNELNKNLFLLLFINSLNLGLAFACSKFFIEN